jgi:hypothetical protein
MSIPLAFRTAVLAAALAACDESPVQTAARPDPPRGGAPLAAVQCQVRVRDAGVGCTDPAVPPGPSPILLGGQGVYVHLANTATTFDSASGIFATDVTVGNLLAQPLSAVQVFFSSGPIATAGRGGVQVANPTGQAMFLGAVQPYFAYGGVLARSVSPPRRWRFRVDPGVEAFSFTVYVQAQIPAPRAVLRWLPQSSCPSCPLVNVTSGGGVLFGVWRREIWYDTIRFVRSTDGGASWSAATVPVLERDTGCGEDMYGPFMWVPSVWTADGLLLYAPENNEFDDCTAAEPGVRVTTGLLRSTDGGITWERLPADGILLDYIVLYALWGSSPADLYAVGAAAYEGRGYILHSRNGFGTYTIREVSGDLQAIWGSGPDTVVAVGGEWSTPQDGGTIVRTVDGGATWTVSRHPNVVFTGVWGTGDGRMWAVGRRVAPRLPEEAVVLHSFDGGESWAEASLPPEQDPVLRVNPPLNGVWGTDGENVYAVGERGVIFHFNGAAWWRMSSGTRARLRAVTGTAWNDVTAAGDVVLHGVR